MQVLFGNKSCKYSDKINTYNFSDKINISKRRVTIQQPKKL
ncbi:hypothetical protein MSIBF_A2240003 [groundwater metagenome]|uniref:Uncharacterized protein n=1 Tax=groundwater metagenome TaxID=717931 RepID=A0A098E8N7_9ZZZZ